VDGGESHLTKKNVTITAKQARIFLVQYHLLNRRVPIEAFLDKIPARFGSIQYDPLDIVARNHELVFQSRVAHIVRGDVNAAIYDDRRLVDAWDKMMGLVAPADWHRLAPVRAFKDHETRNILRLRGQLDALRHCEQVFAHISENGAADASELDLGNAAAATWGPRKNASVACDYLFCVGKLGIHKRSGTRKVYDLMGRILPPHAQSPSQEFSSTREFDKWMILRRVAAVGLLWNRNGVLWQGFGDTLRDSGYRASLFDELVNDGRLEPVLVAGIDRPFYVASPEIDSLRNARPDDFDGELRFLAPLDNMLWDRELVEALFQFSYSWEVYLPAQKRKFGYYVLPMLLDSRIVGRIEPVFDRKTRVLTVKNMWLDSGPDARISGARVTGAIPAALEALGKFLCAEACVWNP
jgi:uncharacterized protein YcaQ